ncbi:Ig-like domain-containing protein [Taibaiella koreensis]|uniref:Ig-like domain-containing protein n=1 Tax=Taibaiella koreensis TaxID=1268548 RepID=UPI000E59AA22|nr:T9SS type A sorting domain-containing protein [Taibaiella koreensis]
MEKTSGLLHPFGRHIISLALTLLFLSLQKAETFAQTAPSYSFSALTGTYTGITGGTAVTAIQDDDEVDIVPIGFTFQYCGVNYTQANVSSNGWLSFNTAGTSTYAGNDLGNLNDGLKPGLMALWDDLSGAGGTATYLTEGAAPNRIFTMEWKNWKWNYNASDPVISFQVKLYETTNVIEFRYKRETAQINGTPGATIAIGDGQGISGYLSLNNATAAPSPSSTTFTTGIDAKPATDQVYKFTPPVPCSGTPVAGTAAATATSICSGADTLNLTGYSNASGLTIQWESSVNGTTWSPVAGATAATYITPNLSSTVSYRAKVTCTASAQTATSNAVTITLTAPTPTVATLPYTESFETWINSCSTTDRPGVSWLSFPANGNNSWRRDDQGASASWGNVADYIYSPVFTTGSHSARFHSGYSTNGLLGIMDLYIDLSPAGAKQIAFDYINTSGSDSLYVELSADGGTTWTQLGSKALAAAWTPVAFSTASTAANAIIRFRARADYGATDIGIDNLNVSGPCTGTPVAGTAAATATSICSGTDTLSLSGYTVAGGVTIQWESSANGTTWSPVSGATDATYITPNLSSTVSYRAKVTCTASAQTATSNVITITVTAPTPTVATLPYTESFETWINSCSTTDRPGVSWLSFPANGNNSWRRDDQGASASWGNVTDYIYSPVFTTGSHSARFHSGYSTDGLLGIMDLYIDLSPAGAKQIAFDYINTSGSDSLYVELSADGGTTWTQLGNKALAAAWTPVAFSTASTAANAIIRFRARADYGSTDIGIDNLNVSGPCTGTPVAGTATATATSICSGTDTLSLSGYTVAGGVTIQWESSANGTTWSPVAGATAATYITPNLSSTVSYRAKVTCTASAQTATSNTVTITVTGPTPTVATLPYTESFETWINGCSTTDRAGASWLTFPANGNNSWRRDDQGASASWGNVTNYVYTPVFTAGSHSARFHSGYSTDGLLGIMDLYINLGSNGTKQIAFDYINTSGTDSLFVELSADGGATWTLLGSKALAAAWSPVSLSTTAFAPNAIIRFRARADYGSTDIGIDNLNITGPPPCVAPTNPTVTSITTTTASLDWVQAGTTAQWQIKYGPAGFNVNTAGTGIYTNSKPYALGSLTPATSYDYYVRTICGAGDTSVWSPVTNFATACVTAPTIVSTTDSFHCGQGAVVLKAAASAGGSIKWYAASTGGTALYTGNVYTTGSLTASTTYYIAAAAGNCESPRQPIVATIAAVPVVNIGNDTTICPGITYTLNAGNPGATYAWNTGASTSVITVNTAGTYSVAVTDAHSCSGSDAINITMGIVPVNTLPATLDLCSGATATLNAGNAGSTFSWTPGGATTQTIAVTAGGTYAVSVISINGCKINSSTDVVMRPLPVAALGNDTSICNGATIVLDAGNTGSTYLWNSGATTQTINAADSGTYSVAITSPYGCKFTDSKHIAYLPAPAVEGFNFIPLFYENLGKVSFTALQPEHVQAYEWDFGDGSPRSTEVNPTHIYTMGGFFTVTLKVSNGCGDFSISQTINVDLTTGVVTPDLQMADVVLFPNPSRDYITIDNKSDKIQMEQVSVYNTLGKLVYSQKTTSDRNHQLPVTQLASGMYTIRILTDKGIITRKFEVRK